MAVYRPTYTDPKTGKKKQARVWWINFTLGGKRVQESSKSTRKTIAVEYAKQRRHDPHMRRRGDGQKLRNSLDDAEKTDLGIAQCDKSSIEALSAGASHVDEFPPVLIRAVHVPQKFARGKRRRK